MESFSRALHHMITLSPDELSAFQSRCYVQTFRRKAYLSQPGAVADEVFFISKGLVRVLIQDLEGVEHTTHFALENQFIADYASFIQQIPASYALQALEDTEAVVMPRKAIEWGYQHLRDGEKLGRLVAEFYFIYLDNRIKNLYSQTPKERYDILSGIFPDIHNRVPQHLIASYLGISPVHLSRIKKSDRLGKQVTKL